MKKRLYLTASAFALLAACDSSTGTAVTDSSSNSSANGTSVTWDSTYTDSILSVTSGLVKVQHLDWYNNSLSRVTLQYPYILKGDTLYLGNENDTGGMYAGGGYSGYGSYGGFKKYIRTSGTSGNVNGTWTYLFIDSISARAKLDTLTSFQLKKYDSMMQVGRDFAKKGGGVLQVAIANGKISFNQYWGKPAYMHMAGELSSEYCAYATGSYCTDIIKSTSRCYVPSAINDTILTLNFKKGNELVTFKYSTRKNAFFMSEYFVPGIYSSSNSAHAPITYINGDNFTTSSWLIDLYQSQWTN